MKQVQKSAKVFEWFIKMMIFHEKMDLFIQIQPTGISICGQVSLVEYTVFTCLNSTIAVIVIRQEYQVLTIRTRGHQGNIF